MILYFSGTGNSKYAARRIADALGEPLGWLSHPWVRAVTPAFAPMSGRFAARFALAFGPTADAAFILCR